MESLLAALAEKGVSVEGMEPEDVVKVAKTLGIEPMDHLDRVPPRVVEYKNKRGQTNLFVETDAYIVGRKPSGLAETVRGGFWRVDQIDQMVEDLLAIQKTLKR